MRKSVWKIVMMISLLFLMLPCVNLFAGSDTVSNVWVFDAEKVPSAVYNVGGDAKSTQVTPTGATSYDVKYQTPGGSGIEAVTAPVGTSMIMINDLNLSAPPAVGYPDIAIAGLSNTAMSPKASEPHVAVSPLPGIYEKTIEVRLTGLPLPGNTKNLILKWSLDQGEREFCTARTLKFDTCIVTPESRFFLAEEGVHTVTVTAIQGAITSTDKIEFIYTIRKPSDVNQTEWNQRDTDGDGIPDLVESSFDDFNPLEDSSLSDKDGDRWTDFQELVRGSDGKEKGSTPKDTDWDGWSDFDEDMRGTDPCGKVIVDSNADGIADAAVTITCSVDADGGEMHVMPIITDKNNDGIPDWSDGPWAEILEEGSNSTTLYLAVYRDKPAASRLYEREYRLGGAVFSDAEELISQKNMGQLTIMDSRWDTLYNQDSLPTNFDLDDQGLSYYDLPSQFRGDIAKSFLLNGGLPSLRVRAGNPVIVRARKIDRDNDGVLDKDDNCPDTHNPEQLDSDADDIGDICQDLVVSPVHGWVVKGWVDNMDDVALADFSPWLKAKGIVWQNGQEWLDAYREFLGEKLAPVTVSLPLSPSSGLGVALLDGIFTWFTELSDGALILLGEPSSPNGVGELDALLEKLGPRALTSLHADLAGQTEEGALLSGFADQVAGFYNNVATFSESTTTRAAAALTVLNQGDIVPLEKGMMFAAMAFSTNPSDLLASYLARLYVHLDQAALDAMDPADRSLLLDPNADFDGDGISNSMELSGNSENVTRPDLADTDADGLADALDSCPLDPANLCEAAAQQVADDDTDAIMNAFDNCRNTYNPDQKDSDGDGIGDICQQDWDGDTYSNTAETAVGSDPRNPLSIPEESTLSLEQGFNIVSFPAEVMGYESLYGFMEDLGGKQVIQSVQVFDPKRQVFIKAGYDQDSGDIYGPDLPLEPGTGLSGLLIYAVSPESYTFKTSYCHEWNLFSGVNVVGSPCTKKTAKEILLEVGSSSIVSGIQRFNDQTGEFDSLMYVGDPSGELGGVDFPLVSGEGYFILMKERVENFTP